MNERLDQILSTVFFTLLIILLMLAVAKGGSLGQMKQFVFLLGVFSMASTVSGAMCAIRSNGFLITIVYISITIATASSAIWHFAQAAGFVGM